MAYLQGKTPISYLQELCTKKGFSPQYDLIANEGAVHEPTFVFKVTGGEFVGTGKGNHCLTNVGAKTLMFLETIFLYVYT